MASSSSNSSSASKEYDVFISFRGEDTRHTLISHLVSALSRNKIRTYVDYELHRGEEISASLIEVIRNSRGSIVVFSKDYASSKWCLNELLEILECNKLHGHLVWPVFYNIDPSNVREQTAAYGEAFAKHELSESKDKLQSWKTALTEAANITDLYSLTDRSRDESELIQNIVNDILQKTNHIYQPSESSLRRKKGSKSKQNQVEKLLIDPTFWRCVGFVSSAAGLLCFALSLSFQLLFGKWYLWKIFLYGVVCFIIAGFMLLPKKRRHSTGMWLKVLIVFAVFVITSLGSFLYEKVTSGKPDRLGLISVGLFALSSFSLSRQIDIGFEVGFTNFLLATFRVQIMQIHEYLLFIAAAIYFAIVVVRSYSESRVEEKVDQRIPEHIVNINSDAPPVEEVQR